MKLLSTAILVFGTLSIVVSAYAASGGRRLGRTGVGRAGHRPKKGKPGRGGKKKRAAAGQFEIWWHQEGDVVDAVDKRVNAGHLDGVVLVPEKLPQSELSSNKRDAHFEERCDDPHCPHPKWKKPSFETAGGYYRLITKYQGEGCLAIDLGSTLKGGGHNVMITKSCGYQPSLWRFFEQEQEPYGRICSLTKKNMCLTIASEMMDDGRGNKWNAYATIQKIDERQFFEFIYV